MTLTRTVSKTRTNFLLDIALAIAFFVAMSPHFTGEPVHEWLSLALGAAAVVHLALHWKWLVAVTRRFLSRLPAQTRLNYILNGLLLAAFAITMVSGIMISKSVLALVGIQMQPSFVWRQLHHTAPNVLLVLMGLHIAVHWKWIVSVAQRTFLRRRPGSPVMKPALAQGSALKAQN